MRCLWWRFGGSEAHAPDYNNETPRSSPVLQPYPVPRTIFALTCSRIRQLDVREMRSTGQRQVLHPRTPS